MRFDSGVLSHVIGESALLYTRASYSETDSPDLSDFMRGQRSMSSIFPNKTPSEGSV